MPKNSWVWLNMAVKSWEWQHKAFGFFPLHIQGTLNIFFKVAHTKKWPEIGYKLARNSGKFDGKSLKLPGNG